MKTGRSLIFFIISVFIIFLSGGNNLFSQGEILSVNPPSAFKGETLHLIIQGNNTNFKEGSVSIDFKERDQYIERSIIVNNPDLLTVMITIDKGIPEYLLDEDYDSFDVITPSHKFPAEFKINKLDEEPESMITVFPIQSIYISDYDFSNLRNLPLLFTISVYSAKYESIKVYVELIHKTLGMVAAADKRLDFPFPPSISTFDNRQFDSYHKNKSSDEIIESASGSGTIPPGEYTYFVYLYDGNNLLSKTESEFYIAESVTGIDMVTPGTPLDDEPEIIYSSTPYFQWFGGLSDYKLTLYEVLDGQNSVDDIATNFPVFETKTFNSYQLYPSFAENLENGKKYAWQITSEILTGSGKQEIISEMYWFIYQKSYEQDESLDNIELYPDDIDIIPGDSIQIKVDGFNIKWDTLKVVCGWQVIPDDMGSVNDEGWFVAGDKPGTAAIIANCGIKEDYITINIIEKK